MKKGMKTIIIAAIVIVALLVAGLLFYKYFVADRIMDRGGMEKPDAANGVDDGVQVLDGNYTYVDNEALLSTIGFETPKPK